LCWTETNNNFIIVCHFLKHYSWPVSHACKTTWILYFFRWLAWPTLWPLQVYQIHIVKQKSHDKVKIMLIICKNWVQHLKIHSNLILLITSNNWSISKTNYKKGGTLSNTGCVVSSKWQWKVTIHKSHLKICSKHIIIWSKFILSQEVMTSPAYVPERLQCMSLTKISLFLKAE